jgi:hypothetical protein
MFLVFVSANLEPERLNTAPNLNTNLRSENPEG